MLPTIEKTIRSIAVIHHDKQGQVAQKTGVSGERRASFDSPARLAR